MTYYSHPQPIFIPFLYKQNDLEFFKNFQFFFNFHLLKLLLPLTPFDSFLLQLLS